MHQPSTFIDSFCQTLPDRHNLLAWNAIMYRDGEVFLHPEGLMYQILLFDHGSVFPQHHVMVIGLN